MQNSMGFLKTRYAAEVLGPGNFGREGTVPISECAFLSAGGGDPITAPIPPM